MKKDWTVRNHARIRADQRYDKKNISKEEMDKIVRQIKSGEAILITGDPRQPASTTQWFVIPEWSTEPVRVVYSPHRDQIVTFLPKVQEPSRLAKLVGR